MSHDPLCNLSEGCTCPPGYWTTGEDLHAADCPTRKRCDCDRIAKVRADERGKLRQAVREVPCTKLIYLDDEAWHEPALIERGKVIAAIDALRGES